MPEEEIVSVGAIQRISKAYGHPTKLQDLLRLPSPSTSAQKKGNRAGDKDGRIGADDNPDQQD